MTADSVISLGARWTVIDGDNAAVLPTIPDCSIDAIVTDPPAGIAFMGKEWDHHKGGRDAWIAWLRGVMAECLRVLKPGGHALIWAIPRTSHWTMTAVEDAGFEIRDVVYHAFGQGFPKSLDVSKAIDRAAGAERPVVGVRTFTGSAALSTAEKGGTYVSGTESAGARREVDVTAPATPEAAQWEGWGTALKPAVEPWILARRPLDGTVAANVLKHGTGAINIDGCRVDGIARIPGSIRAKRSCAPNVDGAEVPCGTVPAPDPHPSGRFPAHLTLSHNQDCREVGTRRVPTGTTYEPTGERDQDHWGRAVPISPSKMLGRITGYADADGMETVDAWDCSEGCAVAMLDAQGGVASRFFAVFDGREDGSSTTINACGNANTRAASTSAGRSTVGSEGSSRTGGFGSMSGGPFPLDGTSTTETATLSITMSKTSSACPPNSIETTTDESGKTTPSPTDDASGARNTGRSNHSRTEQRGRSKGTASTASETHCGSGEQRIASVITPTCGNTEGVERPSPRFFYTAKASRSDREEGLAGMPTGQRDETRDPDAPGANNPRNRGGQARANIHPTVKPTDLMRWLVRLVTPPGGIVLDPFTGSGSTGKAAALEGMRFVGVERDAGYADIARARIAHAYDFGTTLKRKKASRPKRSAKAEQLTIDGVTAAE